MSRLSDYKMSVKTDYKKSNKSKQNTKVKSE